MPRPKGIKETKPRARKYLKRNPDTLATERFPLVMSIEQRNQLDFVAKHERRSRGNLIKWLVAEKYNQLKGEINEQSN